MAVLILAWWAEELHNSHGLGKWISTDESVKDNFLSIKFPVPFHSSYSTQILFFVKQHQISNDSYCRRLLDSTAEGGIAFELFKHYSSTIMKAWEKRQTRRDRVLHHRIKRITLFSEGSYLQKQSPRCLRQWTLLLGSDNCLWFLAIISHARQARSGTEAQGMSWLQTHTMYTHAQCSSVFHHRKSDCL